MGCRGFGFESLRVLELRERNSVIPEESQFSFNCIVEILFRMTKAILFLRCQAQALEAQFKTKSTAEKTDFEISIDFHQ